MRVLLRWLTPVIWARATGKAAWVGLVGPIPKMGEEVVVESSAPRAAAASFSVACVVILSTVMASMVTAS